MRITEGLLDTLGYLPMFDAAFPDFPESERYNRLTASFALSAYLRTLLPNEAPGVRWFRTADESAAIQGGSGGFFRPERLATNGTFHPNEYGHQGYRNALLAVLGSAIGALAGALAARAVPGLLEGLLAINVGLWLLGLVFGFAAMAAGSFTGSPASAGGIAATFAVLAWFVNAFRTLYDWLDVL